MPGRDYAGEIAVHEAAIVALRREERNERRARVGMPPVLSQAEYGREGGLAYVRKHGALPRGGRKRNPTYEEVMASTGGAAGVSERTRRASARHQSSGAAGGAA